MPTIQQTRLKRLNELAFMLENHDKIFGAEVTELTARNANGVVKFDICQWTGKHGCGTAACALGSAALYKPFIKAGLKIIKSVPTFKDNDEWEAGAAFFKITFQESIFLFDPYAYQKHGILSSSGDIYKEEIGFSGEDDLTESVTARHVLGRVRKLIALYEKNENS